MPDRLAAQERRSSARPRLPVGRGHLMTRTSARFRASPLLRQARSGTAAFRGTSAGSFPEGLCFLCAPGADRTALSRTPSYSKQTANSLRLLLRVEQPSRALAIDAFPIFSERTRN